MRKKHLFRLAVCAALALPGAPARGGDDAGTRDQCAAVRKAGRKVVLYAIEVDPANGMPSAWGAEPPIDDRIHGMITVYFHERRIGAARRFDAGLSGDWIKTQDYCFRSDGSLAFLRAELRTLRGGVRVEDRMAFDMTGARRRADRIVRDLETGQDVANLNVTFTDQATAIYTDTRALRDTLGDALR